ncbi:hypothetical protein LF1_38730 [Rubripirellula obstinata]|uniref:Uncharacterized protein n=1 Tax=Rubripirellula obstinata TaxID=406547 RepID=A0A5B1CLB5_9BACT|nr:hypothetical protein LF1_38730 [Rubripirellula obstinata]
MVGSKKDSSGSGIRVELRMVEDWPKVTRDFRYCMLGVKLLGLASRFVGIA